MPLIRNLFSLKETVLACPPDFFIYTPCSAGCCVKLDAVVIGLSTYNVWSNSQTKTIGEKKMEFCQGTKIQLALFDKYCGKF